MRTINRVSALSDLLGKLQSELGRSRIATAQQLAAEVACELEAWRFDLMRIPQEDRGRYETPNPYWCTKQKEARA
jgi:hypothetical protein